MNSLLWKLQDAALTYGDAESMASLWEAVPGSPMGPQLTPIGMARFYATGGLAGAVSSALFHGQQDAAHDLGSLAANGTQPFRGIVVGNRDLINTGIDGLLFYVHKGTDMSGAPLPSATSADSPWTSTRYPYSGTLRVACHSSASASARTSTPRQRPRPQA